MDAFWSEHKVKVKSFKITRSFFNVVNDCARYHCDSDSCSLHLYCLIFFLTFHFQTLHTLFFMIKYLPIVWSGKKTKTKQNKSQNMEKLNEGMSTEMQSCSK